MTDMQRFDDWSGQLCKHPDGDYVLATDAEAAIAEAVAEEHLRLITHGAKQYLVGYSEGQRDMLAKCIAALPHGKYCAVEDASDDDPCDCGAERHLAALRALQEKP